MLFAGLRQCGRWQPCNEGKNSHRHKDKNEIRETKNVDKFIERLKNI